MPPLSPEQRAELLRRTKEAASAFLEDIAYLREVVSKGDASRAEIRRLSGILRRLLVERDLASVADPRLGRVILRAPDNNPAYRAARKWPYLIFVSGRVKVLGGWAGTIFAFDSAQRKPGANPQLDATADDLGRTVDLRLDNFLTQRVLCYRGQWVSRGAVIKYVANVASGVHSGEPKEPEEVILAHLRSAVSLSVRGEGIHMDMFPSGIDVDETEFKHAPDAVDPVLIETLAAAKFVVESPFISALESVVRQEVA